MIVDLSQHSVGEGRRLRVHVVPEKEAITLDGFDASVRAFIKALELAGVVVPAKIDMRIVNLFKKK